MNIFVINKNPVLAAQQLCNSHVVKMIVESAQLLSTHDRFHGIEENRYKSCYLNHPCRKCLENIHNYVWLCHHLNALLDEYTFRYNKFHKCREMFNRCWKQYLEMTYDSNLLSFPKCMINELKVGSDSIEDVVKAYQNYYRFKKKSLKRFQYKNREMPEWLKN